MRVCPTICLNQRASTAAAEFKILFSIVLPLSLPIVTTISLYYAVAHWNVYTAAILYIHDTKLMPLQVILRRMINSASTGDLNIDDEIPPETLAHGRRVHRHRAHRDHLPLHPEVLCQGYAGRRGKRDNDTCRISAVCKNVSIDCN